MSVFIINALVGCQKIITTNRISQSQDSHGKILNNLIFQNQIKTNTKHMADLNQHIGSVHEGEKPFECSTCTSKFSEKSKLNKHIASVHEGKKPFECTICNSKFSQKGNLNSHIASIHKEEKPFERITSVHKVKSTTPVTTKEEILI